MSTVNMDYQVLYTVPKVQGSGRILKGTEFQVSRIQSQGT